MITKRLIKKTPSGIRVAKKAPKKVLTHFRTSVLTRHPSHDLLRSRLPLQRFRSIVRLGSTTTKQVWNNKRPRPLTPFQLDLVVEINSVEGVKNSASKLLMKQCFTRAGVKTAQWWTYIQDGFYLNNVRNDENYDSISDLFEDGPIIAKSHHGSRGVGNTKLNTQSELEQWMQGKNLSGYIFEKFVPYTREYRLHIVGERCFYTCRKLIRNDAPEGTWQRHDDVCTWVLETNPSFRKPSNWDAIVADCVKARKALGLDICAFDVLVQGEKANRTTHEWLILESCSAPSFGEITGQKYLEEIDKLLKSKYAGARV